MLIFEAARKTNYSHYHALESVCSEIWEAWGAFAETKEVDGRALEASPVFVDMQRVSAAMPTPGRTARNS